MRRYLVAASFLVALVSSLSGSTFAEKEEPTNCDTLIDRVLVCTLTDPIDLIQISDFLLKRRGQYRVLYVLDTTLDCDCKWKSFREKITEVSQLRVSGTLPCLESALATLNCGDEDNGDHLKNEHWNTLKAIHGKQSELGNGNTISDDQPGDKVVHTHVTKLLQMKKFLLRIVDLRNEMSKLLNEKEQMFLLDIFHNHIDKGKISYHELEDGWHTFSALKPHHHHQENITANVSHDGILNPTQQKLIIFGSIVLVIVIGVIAMLCAKMTAEKKQMVQGIKVAGDLDIELHEEQKTPCWKSFLRKLQTNSRRKAIANADENRKSSIVYKRLPTMAEISKGFSKETKVEERRERTTSDRPKRNVTFESSTEYGPQNSDEINRGIGTFAGDQGRERFTVDTEGNIISTLEELEATPIYENQKYPKQNRKIEDQYYSPIYENQNRERQYQKHTPGSQGIGVGSESFEAGSSGAKSFRHSVQSDAVIDKRTVLAITTSDEDTPRSSLNDSFVPHNKNTDSTSDFVEMTKPIDGRPRSGSRRSSINPEDIKVTVMGRSTNNNGIVTRGVTSPRDAQTCIPADLSMDSISSEDAPMRRVGSPVKSLIRQYERDEPSFTKSTNMDSDPDTQKQIYAQLATEAYRKEKKRLTCGTSSDRASTNGNTSTRELLASAMKQQRRFSTGIGSDSESSD